MLCLFFKDGVAFFEDTSKRQRQQQERKTGMHTYDASDEGPDLGVDGKEEIIRIAEGEPQYVRRFFFCARARVRVCLLPNTPALVQSLHGHRPLPLLGHVTCAVPAV